MPQESSTTCAGVSPSCAGQTGSSWTTGARACSSPLGLVDGESRYDELETRLASAPKITVPTIAMEGDANGAPHPEPEACATKFTGKYEHRTVSGGVGHDLPQEAPEEFAKAK